jgi:hypothetical protein
VVVEGVAEEAEVEELVMLPVEDCEAPLVVEEAELCSVLERPDSEDGLEEEEPEVDPTEDPEAVLVEPLAVVKKLPVDGMTVFGCHQQY